jgi:CRP-like cAMP-binding protein
MSAPRQHLLKNKLLNILPEHDFLPLAPHLELVALPRGSIIAKRGENFEHVYFLESGIASLVATTPAGNQAEAGVFGFEGYVPTTAIAGVDSSTHDISMQWDGEAYRMSYEDFRVAMEENRNLWKVIIRSIEAFSVQLAYTAVCNAVHDVNERLARWLLMCDDRISGNRLPVTHEFLSMMLSVRRASVTTALHVLEGNGFIRSERGIVVIRNREALEEFAHDAYGIPESEYRRLMTGLF